MINSSFSPLDWFIFLLYFGILIGSSYWFSRAKIESTREYFTASNTMPTLAVAISLLATTQSAATFLGVPEFAYAHDFTLIGLNISTLLAVLFVVKFFIPAFYEMKVITVYELLEKRYGQRAKKQAGVMFLLGRIMASGARLYIAALAISMILFLDITLLHMIISILILVLGALAYTYFGGIKSVIFSDVIQAITYISAGVVVLFYLYTSLDGVDIFALLHGENKLRLVDTSWNGDFGIIGLLSGWLLLNIAAFGLDQDMSQRVLSCKNKKDASRSMILSILFSVPIVLLFLAIGALLYLFYDNANLSQNFEGEKITIFMYYILHEMPEGVRGFVTVGAIAAALSSTNSVLGAMASVAIEDLYKPWRVQKSPQTDEKHFLKASRVAVLIFALLLSAMAILSYFWQRYTELPLISFALGVMAFAYTGLLGVFFSAIFTSRGSAKMVPYSLAGGFLCVLALQPYIFGLEIGFALQITIGTIVAFLIMQSSNTPKVS